MLLNIPQCPRKSFPPHPLLQKNYLGIIQPAMWIMPRLRNHGLNDHDNIVLDVYLPEISGLLGRKDHLPYQVRQDNNPNIVSKE